MGKADQVQRFRQLAQQLSNHFPELDLAFSMCPDEDVVYCHTQEDSLEILLGGDVSPEELVYEAIFAIKELSGKFDA
jgi:hypothetical protein